MLNDDGHQYEDGDTIMDIFDDYGIHFFSPELEKQILLTTKKRINRTYEWLKMFSFFFHQLSFFELLMMMMIIL